MRVKFWRYLALAMGQKSGKTNKEADRVALIRLLFILQCVITNCFIVASCIKNIWG